MEDAWPSICDLESKCKKLEPPKSWKEMRVWVMTKGMIKFQGCLPVYSLPHPFMTLLAAVLPDTTPQLRLWHPPHSPSLYTKSYRLR